MNTPLIPYQVMKRIAENSTMEAVIAQAEQRIRDERERREFFGRLKVFLVMFAILTFIIIYRVTEARL